MVFRYFVTLDHTHFAFTCTKLIDDYAEDGGPGAI